MATISNLAFVHPGAKIDDDVTIDAFAYIDDDVVIGKGCHIHPHASVLAGARIGQNNEIFEGAIIAATPQDFRWKGQRSYVVIGNNNEIWGGKLKKLENEKCLCTLMNMPFNSYAKE